MPEVGRYIAVIGSPGSGKSYAARLLARRFDLHYVNIDELHWLPNWTDRPAEEKRELLKTELQHPGWVIDGFTSNLRPMMEAELDTVIWLDLSMQFVIPALIVRTIRRCITKELVCNGNIERFWVQFHPRESLWVFAVRTFKSRREDYADYLRRNPHLTVHRLRTRRQVNAFLASLK